jgi:hypothetical protein
VRGARAGRGRGARAVAAELGIDRLAAAFIVAAVVVRVIFWAYTHRRYEDALITITHSVNAANGHGLIHHPGEGHVQGFTSAISVLIPLAGEIVHAGWGFAAIRLASLAAAVVTIVFANQIALRLRLGTWARVLLLGYLSLDYLQIFYGMAGMETQIAVAVLVVVIWAVETGRTKTAGALIGLSVLVRPDFVLLAGPAVVVLAMRHRHELRRVAVALAVAALVAAPWFVFATAYYGSPVPQTITAKSQQYSRIPPLRDGVGVWAYYVSDNAAAAWDVDWSALAPLNENPLSRGAEGLKVVTVVICVLALIGLAVRRRARELEIAFAYTLLFLGYVVVFTPPGYFRWYWPPLLAAVVLFAACAVDVLSRRARPLAAIGTAVLVAVYAAQAIVMFPLDRTIQTKIEATVRVPMAEYLHRVVKPGQTVVSEAAGYVGYYGKTDLLDFPGLTSRRVSTLLARLPREQRTLTELIHQARPDWIVLRPRERAVLEYQYPALAHRYRVARRFFVRPEDSRLEKWGVRMRTIDRDFSVLKRV